MDRRRAARMGVFAAMLCLLTLASGCFLFPKRTSVRPAATSPGSLQGIVRLANGQPAAGVSVALFKTASVAVTDADGRFSFPVVPAGWQSVLANKEGFVTASSAVYLKSGQQASVALSLLSSEGQLHGASRRVPSLCGSCHQLHQGSPALLKGGTSNAPCYVCHSPDGTAQPSYPRFPDQSVYEQTPHFASTAAKLQDNGPGDCANCHLPHGVTNEHANPSHLLINPAAGSSNPVCYNCHTTAGASASGIWGWPGQSVFDANLHAAKSSSDLAILPVYPGSEAQAGECYNCHNPHGQRRSEVGPALTTALTRAEGAALCVECHTQFQAADGANTKHRCTFCHNPHQVGNGAAINVVRPGTGDPRTLDNIEGYKDKHRRKRLIKNSYCLGCHKPGNSSPNAPDPFQAATGFNFTGAVPANSSANLHAVHVKGPIGWGKDADGIVRAGTSYRGGEHPATNSYYSAYQRNAVVGEWDKANIYKGKPIYNTVHWRICFPGGYDHETHQVWTGSTYVAPAYPEGTVPTYNDNKAWCVDCHDVHPSPASDPVSDRRVAKLLRTSVITALTRGAAGYATKNSCGMTSESMCHQGTNGTDNGCDWCHKDFVGSPGFSCQCGETCPQHTHRGGDGWGGTYGFTSAHGNGHGVAGGLSARRTIDLSKPY